MSIQDYQRILKQRLNENRYIHSIEVSKEAVRLAEKYGANSEKAKIAGLLHDICKNDSDETLLQTFQEFGIILSTIEKSSRKLWHAMAGAAVLEHELHISDPEILAAVRYHTTARAGMSLLEKVIYLADFTSADRDYSGVGEMRAAVDKSMEEAMEQALQFTILDLVKSEHPVHPDTLDAYNEGLTEK